MKKILFLALLLGLTISSFGQRKKDRIKALKVAHITQKLDLSSDKATKFWPIYNEHSKKEIQLRRIELVNIRKNIKAKGGIDNFTEKEATLILSDVIRIENELFQSKKTLIKKLKNVVSTKQIIKLYQAEQEFNKRLLRRLRDKRTKD